MALSDFVNTFGTDLKRRYGERVHKIAINAGLSCPNRDGTKGRGGCTFCNNASFSPSAPHPPPVADQLEAGRRVILRRTGAKRYLAYFQAYTNTYGDPRRLEDLYRQALAQPDVVGLSVGTRPDCCPPAVLDLLASLRDQGYEVWLELGLQSACDATLARVNRGHGFADYRAAALGARARGLPICTHLIVGLPGEGRRQALWSLERVLDLGTDGLKLHPLHVVKQTKLAFDWRRGEYNPLSMGEYISVAADLIERTPVWVVYHRLTGTAATAILLAPEWCSRKWIVLNGIEAELRRRGTAQGAMTTSASPPAGTDGRQVAA